MEMELLRDSVTSLQKTFESFMKRRLIPQRSQPKRERIELSETIPYYDVVTEDDLSVSISKTARARLPRLPELEDPDAFCVLYSGEAMFPRLINRQNIYLSPAATPGDGDIVLVEFKGRTYLREYNTLPDGSITLTNSNEQFRPFDFTINPGERDKLVYLGKMV